MGFRYIGSKSKIISHVLKRIASIVGEGAHVVDLMCGTAAVSSALKECGYVVTAADVMTFSYHHARVALLLNEPPLFKNACSFIAKHLPNMQKSLFPQSPYEQMLNCLNIIKPVKGYFWKEFSFDGNPKNSDVSRNYFTPENAMKIDGLRACIKKLHEENQITDIEHSLLLHDLIMAANDIANIAGTYGHYLSNTIARAKDPIILTPTQIKHVKTDKLHTVLHGFAEDLASKINADLCYIDPPYVKRQYAANYHVLETLAREDEPEAIGVSGLRPWRDQHSKFCTKTQIRDSFDKVFSGMACPHFLISYSEDGLLSIDELESFFSNYGKVKTTRIVHKRFKSNDSKLQENITEYIIHLGKH
jgi:adenine-specific DNA-methyltransferase